MESNAPRVAETPPPEFLDAVRNEAAIDAERVIAFLDSFSNEARKHHPGVPLSCGWRTNVSRTFLLELAAALRIFDWERQGIVHPRMNLPAAHSQLLPILQTMGQLDREPTLSRQCLQVFYDHFVWQVRQNIHASIALDELDDELVGSIAQFLWNHRHDWE